MSYTEAVKLVWRWLFKPSRPLMDVDRVALSTRLAAAKRGLRATEGRVSEYLASGRPSLTSGHEHEARALRKVIHRIESELQMREYE